MIEVTCANCEKVFDKCPAQVRRTANDFCSRSCASIRNNTLYPKRVKELKNTCERCNAACRNKFCTQKCATKYKQERYIKAWLDGRESGTVRTGASKTIRAYLIELAGHKCSQCGWAEVNKHSGTVPLELDHIDGNYKNNSPENLRILCPNCHSLTSTYRMLNAGKGRADRYK